MFFRNSPLPKQRMELNMTTKVPTNVYRFEQFKNCNIYTSKTHSQCEVIPIRKKIFSSYYTNYKISFGYTYSDRRRGEDESSDVRDSWTLPTPSEFSQVSRIGKMTVHESLPRSVPTTIQLSDHFATGRNHWSNRCWNVNRFPWLSTVCLLYFRFHRIPVVPIGVSRTRNKIYLWGSKFSKTKQISNCS